MFRAGLYARVSTNDQQTLSMQIRAMREYAARRGWTIAVNVREVGSGATKREAREKLLEAARRREIDVVLAWRLDRWGRPVPDLLATPQETGTGRRHARPFQRSIWELHRSPLRNDKYARCAVLVGAFGRKRYAMFGRFFPRQFDNSYRGPWLALVILGLLLFFRLAQTGMGLLSPVVVIRGPDGILFETFNAPAQAAFTYVFRLLCFLNILACLIGVLALVRYRAMVPLTYLMLILLLAGQKVLGLLYPIPRAPDAPGGMIVLVMLAVTFSGGLRSVLDTRKKQPT